ncbi:hypothetical protein [Nonomuraea typhae]|uniref:hypothetical protein n=1 Tax=Nonomuraea typhae TaxID=2603600 RepID=UPI0012F9E753|nr:hypothetical protein [Nonomuraea typhae]
MSLASKSLDHWSFTADKVESAGALRLQGFGRTCLQRQMAQALEQTEGMVTIGSAPAPPYRDAGATDMADDETVLVKVVSGHAQRPPVRVINQQLAFLS